MNKSRIILVLGFFSVYLSISVSFGYATPTQTLQVSFIDVGQGDSALIHGSDGFDILIDGGKTSAGPTVVEYIRGQGIDDIDVMVATHADSDHIGGLIAVLNTSDIVIDQVLYNGYPGDTNTWTNFTTAVTNEGLTLNTAQFPMTYTWGTTTATSSILYLAYQTPIKTMHLL